MEIELTAKGLAKYIVADPAAQRKVLRDYKWPDPEGQAQAQYYREALATIRRVHASPLLSKTELTAAANALLARASTAGGPSATRLRNNARALAEYEAMCNPQMLMSRRSSTPRLTIEGVIIRVVPDLRLHRDKGDVFQKFDFSAGPSDGKTKRINAIVAQLLFAGLHRDDASIRPTQIEVVHVATGTVVKAAPKRARITADVEAACAAINLLWPTITAPTRPARPTGERSPPVARVS